MVSGSRVPSRLNPDGAGSYIISVYGKIARQWEPELQMSLTYTQTEQGTISVLKGRLPDQAALLGALGRLAMWGYLILHVYYDVSFEAQDGD
jgi:hypothetical protein